MSNEISDKNAATIHPRLISLSELSRLANDPGMIETFGPTGNVPYLAFNLDDPAGDMLLPLEVRPPCPIIAVGSPGHPAASFADVVVDDIDPLYAVARNICAFPFTASVLVQVLRQIELVDSTSGFLIESLAYATLQSGEEHQQWLRFNPREKPPRDYSDPTIICERNQSTLCITLNRPARGNALSAQMRDALVEALNLPLVDQSIESVVLSGNGKCFSTGGDLAEFGEVPDATTGHIIRSLRMPAAKLFNCGKWARTRVLLHGHCIGAGVEIASHAQQVSARSDTTLELPEIRYGLIPGAGGCVGLVKRIGRQHAAYLCLSGDTIDAKRAMEIGLVDEIS